LLSLELIINDLVDDGASFGFYVFIL
jgi:hypothetical protein